LEAIVHAGSKSLEFKSNFMAGKTRKQVFACPLCSSSLSRERYFQIIGVWEERGKLEKTLREELRKLQDERADLRKQKARMRGELKRAVKAATAEATQKERRRADRLAMLIQGKTQQIRALTTKVKELEEQLKKGTTPQIEGLNYERELVKDLKRSFQADRIEHHGQAGDILQLVRHRGKQIGSIVFECKLTSRFLRSYLVQTKKAVAQRKATYGVLVTLASKKGTAGFWVDGDILVVHPFGAVHVAGVLRQSLLDLYATQISAQEADRRAKALMEYVKSDEFKSSVSDTVFRTIELYEMLKKEVKSHRKVWRSRFDHYRQIHENTREMQARTVSILAGAPKRELREQKLLSLPSF
jgi:hypothetical protein